MDHAPLPSPNPNSIPPADADFDRTFQANLDHTSGDCQDEPMDNDSPTEVTEEFRRLSHNTQAEVRELQRVMMTIARHGESEIAKTSAARAYRDLEVLRMAKLGKPLAMNAQARIDPKRATKSAPIAVLSEHRGEQAA